MTNLDGIFTELTSDLLLKATPCLLSILAMVILRQLDH